MVCPFCGGAPTVRATAGPLPPRLSRASRIAIELTLGGALTGCAADARDRPDASGLDVHPSAAPGPSPSTSASAATLASVSASATPSAAPEEIEPPRRVIPIYGSSEIQILQRVEFGPGSAVVPLGASTLLDELVKVMDAYPKAFLVCVGHALPSETTSVEKLAAARAKAVADALAKKGIAKERLRARPAKDEGEMLAKLPAEERPRFRSTSFELEDEHGERLRP